MVQLTGPGWGISVIEGGEIQKSRALLLTLPSHLPSALHARNDNVALSANESSGQVATCEQHLSVSQAKQYTGPLRFMWVHKPALTGRISIPSNGTVQLLCLRDCQDRRHSRPGQVAGTVALAQSERCFASLFSACFGLAVLPLVSDCFLAARGADLGRPNQMQRLGILKPSPPAALPVPYRVGGEISMTKKSR